MNAPAQLLGASADHPFPGLRPFAYQDHAYFFGREDQTFALYRLIDRSRFVAVVGSSGSGKSSLVRAGLLPLLDIETGEAGGRSWLWSEMRPGDAPLQRLTNLLADLSSDDDPVVASGRRERIAAQVQRSSFGISEALAEIKSVTGKTLVLVVDQFEELFRYAAAGTARVNLTADDARARDEAAQFVQLLLEASRAPLQQINIMLTMRSDFIGDCARFHGLPEAVCAAQFLVPSLTRDQLDDVIRRPVEKAGATIDAELVERLLNDCGTELDQLPVLQHCLSRLWDEAGTSRGGADAQASRHLSLNHYREIGEFSDALSRHANEILNDLGPGLELAVTQVFSALSELDKEGRAIRRALRFSQLVAETGISEADIRRVLDRFRAEDCSFVTPPRSEVKMIDGTTRIDVGHEALLRRWEKVSGHGIELGWLRAEQQAGERYRGLLAMADSGATLPAHLVDERLAWWKARPRTAAWAERYGGGFESVVRLLQASRRRQRAKLVGVVAAFASVASVALVMFLMWQRAERLQSDADASRKNVVNALNVTKNVVGRLFGSFNDGGTTASFTAQFLEDAKPMLDDLEKNENPPLELSEIRISLLFGFYDARLALGEHDEAQRHAEQAFAISRKLLERYPDNQNLLRHIYSASFRLGDLKAIDFANEEAERHFKVALDFAERRARIKPGDLQVQRDIIFIGNKLADLDSSKSNWQPALDRYTAGLKIAEAIADKSPVDTATQKNRIAQLLSHRKSPGDAEQALATYREALAILTELRRNSPDNATLLSNQALTHRRIGGLLKDKPGEALVEYQAAVANRKKLFERDPGNVPWRLGLATDYKLLGETLLDLKDLRGTQINFALASQLEEGLVLKNPRNIVWQRTSAVTNMKRGDVLLARADEGIASPDPPMDEPTRRIADALLRYQTAEAVFRKLADDPAAGSSRFPNLFNVRFKIGDVLVRQKKYGEALDSFQSALAVASMTGSPSRRFVEWHMKVADRIALACEHLARETAGGPPTAVLASGDQPDRLTCYQKALSAIEAAAAKEPDDVEVKEKRAALSAKIEALRPK